MTQFIAGGLTRTDFDCCYQRRAQMGLTYYVLAKVLWNPEADVDELIRDYCRAGWRPAASEIERYFLALERKTEEIYRSSQHTGRRETPEVIATSTPTTS